MLRPDRLAIFLTIVTFFVLVLFTNIVFERIPHIEDEMAYVWQARAIAEGAMMVPSPPCPKCFLVPFVVDYEGNRFGKYPLGWPVMLSIGEFFGLRDYVNPFLSAFSIWLTYLLAKKITNSWTSLLASFLMATSPFFLMNSASLLSHAWSLFLTLGVCLGWIDTFQKKSKIPTLITAICSGLCLGVLAITRPMTAIGVAVPFAILGTWQFFKGTNKERKLLFLIGGSAALLAGTLPLWQYAVTGDPLLNPYSLWWSYDRVGFGPGIGVQEGGYKFSDIFVNQGFSLYVATLDFFGWPFLSWIFVPFGIIVLYRNKFAWAIFSIFGTLLIAYSFYWIGSWLVGPRYYYESLPGVALFSAVGITWLPGKLSATYSSLKQKRWTQVRFGLGVFLPLILILCNILYYTPFRLQGMQGLYGATASRLLPFQTSEAFKFTPALVIVTFQNDWIEYGTLVELSSPFLDSPFIFILSQGSTQDQIAINGFPNRRVIYYYPDEPYTFYPTPR